MKILVTIIAMIGAGRLGLGPICDMLSKTGNKVVVLARKGSGLSKYLDSPEVKVINNKDGTSKTLAILDSLSAAIASPAMITVCLCDDIGKTLSEMEGLELLVVSVGPGMKDVVNHIPQVSCPVMLLENDYDLAVDLAKENSNNRISPCVVDCHSPVLELNDNIIMDYDPGITIQVYDPDGSIQEALHGDIVYCKELWELDIYHYRKFFGVNLPHRVLAYIAFSEARQEGVAAPNAISDYMTVSVMQKYECIAESCINASFFTDPERIKQFYEQDSYEDASDVYCSILNTLAMLIAEKTKKTGDTFARVIKAGTDNYLPRLNQTIQMIQMLIADVAEHEEMVDSMFGSSRRLSMEDDLQEFLNLLEDLR